jgi:fructose-bisphosphate aldolase class I
MRELQQQAAALVADGRGILAADESVGTMSKRLEGAGVPASATARRDYRELLIRTPDLSRWVSGVILNDETVRQQTADGTPFASACAAVGLLAGIKVDTGATPLPYGGGAVVTEGLDGLRDRLVAYREQGLVFAKWRAVLTTVGMSRRALRANAHALARYAALCQDAGLTPIVEPEFVMDGDHGIAVAQAITGNALDVVFAELDAMGVDLSGLVLKPNMVVAGARAKDPAGPDEVAWRTVTVLTRSVPPTVPGIAFLSGGQSNDAACANLAAINRRADLTGPPPWRLTFSFGRALVDDALATWAGEPANVVAAQIALADNCARASQAAAARSDSVALGA